MQVYFEFNSRRDAHGSVRLLRTEVVAVAFTAQINGTVYWKSCLHTVHNIVSITTLASHEIASKSVFTVTTIEISEFQCFFLLSPYKLLTNQSTNGLTYQPNTNPQPIHSNLTKPNPGNQTKQIKTPWSECASELYRPSDCRLSTKWLPTFCG
jgi:hypothetical protein